MQNVTFDAVSLLYIISSLYTVKLLFNEITVYVHILVFPRKFGERYHRYKKAVRLVSILDCLLSLVILASQDGYTK